MDDDEIVFAIDLRPSALDEERRALPRHELPAAPPPPPAPLRPIRTVALLVDDGDPILRPIEPTRDVRWLDALGRLLRYSVLLDLSVEEIAERYGGDYERGIIGGLPRWARAPQIVQRTPRVTNAILMGKSRGSE